MTQQFSPTVLGPPLQAGPWRGWSVWTAREPFEEVAGPFYTRREADGRYTTGFRPCKRHLNSAGILHGGAIATFVDYSLFGIAYDAVHGKPGVTATLNTEFLRATHAVTMLTGRGDVLRTTKSLVFVRGLIMSEDTPVVSFSGVIKLIHLKTRAG